ncbi:MAG: PorT family protein [Bacteroidaceae bacterium]|nr:PorT family protein [Bacteroidaceae bacterium]
MKRLQLLLLGFLVAAATMGQEQRIQNRPYLDNRFLHYGFFVGLDMMDLEMENNGYVDPISGQQWYTDVDNYQPGFVVGVLGEVRLSKYLGLRVQPTIHFGQKHIVFHEQLSGRDSTQNLKSTYLSVPVALKMAAPRYNNFRPYFSLGLAPTLDLTTRKHQALRTQSFDCYVELAAGCDIYLPYFKLIPELRFSFGLRDILVHERDDLSDASLMKFTNSLSSCHAKMITLAFYFE